MDAPKRYDPTHSAGMVERATGNWVQFTKHARIVAEKDAEIAALKTERDRWHADANLMLGFADLAYAAGATPSSSDLIAARDRVVAAIRALAEKG